MALFFSNKYKKIIIIIIFLSCLIFFSGNAVLAEEIITPFPYNPAANYCKEMGYEWIIKTTAEGDEVGFCKISDDILCDGWEFLTGKCGQEYNYCQRQGYQFKSLSNSEKCQSAFSPDCVACVFKNGAEIETSKTMKLDKESKCGDKICYPPKENYGNCPQDCASGLKDGYCDKVKDNICDPDCVNQEDIDCGKSFLNYILYITLFLTAISLIAGIALIYKKFKNKTLEN